MKNQMPPLSIRNSLSVEATPPELQLNTLEAYLISLRKLFVKMFRMSKGQQRKVKGSVVNIPIPIPKIFEILPSLTVDPIIFLKYKRKLSYKNSYHEELIEPLKIVQALYKLSEINPFYKEVNVGEFKEFLAEQLIVPKNSLSEEVQETASSSSTSEDSNYLNDALPIQATCLQPTEFIQTSHQCDIQTINVAPGENQTPIGCLSDTNVEYLAFPFLFPTAKNGLKEKRRLPLTITQYFNSRLLHFSGKFSSNPDYLFFAQYLCELVKIQNSIGINLKKVHGQLTAISLLKEQYGKQSFNEAIYKFMSQVPGTPSYWKVFMYDLLSMVRQLGVPDYWHTVSCADLEWPDLYILLSRRFLDKELSAEDITRLSYQEKCDLLNRDPAIVARQFQYRLENYVQLCLKANSLPLGAPLLYYAIKIEFQLRGSPHAHMLLWTKQLPQLLSLSVKRLIDQLDNVVQCQIPDDKELADLVTKYQTHRHSQSCFKFSKTKRCRYNFPKFPVKSTVIALPLSDSLPTEEKRRLLKKKHDILMKVFAVLNALDPDDKESLSFLSIDDILLKANCTQSEYEFSLSFSSDYSIEVHFERDVKSIYINNYNSFLLYCYRANIDLQPVLNSYSCIMYLVKYFSKEESSVSVALSSAVHQSKDLHLNHRDTMKKIAAAFLSSREVSQEEACFRTISGLYLRKIFPACIFINTNVPNERVRMAKPKRLLEELDNSSTDVFVSNIFDKYADRPNRIFKDGQFHKINNLTLAEFVSYYRQAYYEPVSDTQPNEIIDDLDTTSRLQLPKSFSLMTSGTRFHLRRVPAVIRFPSIKQNDDPEKYYHHLLVLYYPWRHESELKGGDGSYSSKYEEEEVQNFVLSQRSKFEAEADGIDKALKARKEELNNEQFTQWFENSEDQREREEEVLNDLADEAGPNSSGNASLQFEVTISIEKFLTSVKQFPDLLNTLTKSQKTFFNEYFDDLVSVSRQRFFPVRKFFLHGGGGVGKSHLIRTIVAGTNYLTSRNVDNMFKPRVAVCALTGVAAFNIDGTVLDSTFSMPRNKPGFLPKLSALKLAELQDKWSICKQL